MSDFIDPLEMLVNKHKKAMENESPETETITDPTPITPSNEDRVTNEINYGDDDITADMAREDEEREALQKARRDELSANEKPTAIMPPNEYDENYNREAVEFQANKLEIVSRMVNTVVAKHNLRGYISNENNLKMKVMGELIDVYHRSGEVITQEFEQIILDNWTHVEDNSVQEPVLNNDNSVSSEEKKSTEPVVETPTINIVVEQDAPVTVNVDESIVANFDTSNIVNINVKRVSEKELKAAKIIENTQQEGIISVYDSGINDVPITLPMSGYRCVMRPINWFDFIRLTAPTSQNGADNELKKWSVIYKHMKNPSIGEFKDFDDFLKKTKYKDKELLMWALLVATADDEETLSLRCQNPKCEKQIDIKYHPREIIELDEKLIPSHYDKTHNVTVGDEAFLHWEDVNAYRTRYKLPNSGIVVEINEPSAYEFITEKLPLIQKLYERYRPGKSMSEFDSQDPSMLEFDYLSANALLISSMSIIRDDKEYRFTTWEDIEYIITEAIDTEDSSILLRLIEKTRENKSPVSFYIQEAQCPSCKLRTGKIPVDDIGNTLLFQVSRRLASTQINLIETD